MTNHAGSDRAEIAARLAVAVGRLNRRIRPAGELTPGQVSALSIIVRQGPIRPGDIARAERVAAPTITRLLTELENRALITRSADPDDGRSFFVSATEAGTVAIATARRQRAERVLALFDELDTDQIERLGEALDALELVADSTTAD
ncbi:MULTISPECIES: MarR family winged helix-turn-helix transcriptional regulator [Herbiconiux]|jgi:DNA-binding MarR family transcriptional regulator|uniref:DNA-binding MarR family transcriptional regulator n=1 Tax=Herbiconiux flava TaxID=881268 RepID=A0A852STK8_9MICO|nr:MULTISPECIES: MarR family transcriptional regulator [Herbiconiux]NQX36855.1 MarR family transcriptional regulator [Herbiconiux sp. VKM Ac-2851]NYD72259.1 DNA-binding MarR family transcriptional regulator [Herbiconiux flava]GLK17778.1 MarR family transcriptional regulator [Herbiconiux flava]